MVRLTTEFIAKHNSHTKRRKDEEKNHYLRKLTHLYMTEKNIEEIDNLTKCRNLSVLYLYDNKLTTTMNLGTAPNLTHLYLQNNNICKLEDLKPLTNLTKLYLGHNNLLVIEGLQSLEMLRELHVENQRLPPGEKLLFDPRSIFSISRSLEILNVTGNHLDTFKSLIPLTNLVELQARDNDVTEFEGISDALASWPALAKLDLTGNAISHVHKYRDRVIVVSRALDLRQRQQLHRQPFAPHSAVAFNPTSQYIIKGLPGAQRRFEAILAKSRSLPNSAVAPMQRLRLHGELPHGTVFQTRQGLQTNGLNGDDVGIGEELPPVEAPLNGGEQNVPPPACSEAELSYGQYGHGDVVGDKNGVGDRPMEGEEMGQKDAELSRLDTPYVQTKQLGFTGSKPHTSSTSTRARHAASTADHHMFDGKLPDSERRRYPTLRGRPSGTAPPVGEKGAAAAVPDLNNALLAVATVYDESKSDDVA